MTYLNKLRKIVEVLVLIDRQLVVFVNDSVVLYFAVVADTERVIARKVGAFPHQKETILEKEAEG